MRWTICIFIFIVSNRWSLVCETPPRRKSAIAWHLFEARGDISKISAVNKTFKLKWIVKVSLFDQNQWVFFRYLLYVVPKIGLFNSTLNQSQIPKIYFIFGNWVKFPKCICCARWAGFIKHTFRKSVVTCSVHLKLPLQDLIWPDVKVGIFQGEAESSQGLSVFILCSGIRPCASQIYPYVTKKRRVLSRPVPSAAAAAPPSSRNRRLY